MSLQEIIKQATSGDIPTGTLGSGGIIALLIAVMVAKRSAKFILVLVGLALFAVAIWWHYHNKQ